MKKRTESKPAAPRGHRATKPARRLPPALIENARALSAQATKRLRARGEAALEVVREKLGDLAENVFEIGQALGELAAPGVAGALGYDDFDDTCRSALGLAPTTARRWMTLAARLDRRFVLEVGPERARAIMGLADALPEKDAEPEALLARTLTLPTGERVVVREASTSELDEAAKSFRHARPAAEATRRGFTTTPEERAVHATIAKRLTKAPRGAQVKSRLVAQRGPEGARLVIEMRLSEWREVVALLAKT